MQATLDKVECKNSLFLHKQRFFRQEKAKIFVSSQQKISTMKVFMIEIYNDEMVAKMQRLKDEKGITFASQCRAGLKMYFKDLENRSDTNC